MYHRVTRLALAGLLAVAAGVASPRASSGSDFRPTLEVLVGGSGLRTYAARGVVYIEAQKGREYEIRLHNPYDVRVAVALSVDGLNTIDARHTTAAEARKWVIEPHDTITISGWQTSLTHARRFEFTTEERSYGAWLGRTSDLGVISAVFYRERAAVRLTPIEGDRAPRPEAPAAGREEKSVPPAEASAPSAASAGADRAARAQAAGEDDYAATGIGRRTDHPVRQVHLDLEDHPAASVSIRYEYRAQLVQLGVLPPRAADSDPLARRERARGFDGFCPDPRRDW